MVQVLSGLEDHLREKEVEGVRILTFFHRQIDEYMKERYGTNRNRNHNTRDYGLKRFEDEGKLRKRHSFPVRYCRTLEFTCTKRRGRSELLHLLPEEEKHKNKETKRIDLTTPLAG